MVKSVTKQAILSHTTEGIGVLSKEEKETSQHFCTYLKGLDIRTFFNILKRDRLEKVGEKLYVNTYEAMKSQSI